MDMHIDTSDDFRRWAGFFKFKAILMFPEIDGGAERRQFLASAIGQAMVNLSAVEPEDATETEQVANTRAALTDEVNALGGALTLAQARRFSEYDADARVESWFSAGCILALVWRMEANHALNGGASVRKAIHILEANPRPAIHRNTKDLRAAWSIYRPVAHLCAALFDEFCQACVIEDIEADDVMQEVACNLDRLLVRAEAYRAFGQAFTPARSREPILPADLWTVTTDADPVAVTATPLGDEDLAAAAGYKAPQQL